MEDTVTCPICETENPPDATHCEVCGERLVPAAAGEDLSPEENVAGDFESPGEMASEGTVVGFAVEDSEPDAVATAPADETADFQPAAFADEDEDEAVLIEQSAPEEVHTDELDVASIDIEEEILQEASAPDEASVPDEAPQFLYSPIDGTAYPVGSAEYEEGFGPNGEELVAEAPLAQPSEAASQADADDDEYEVALESDEESEASQGPVSEGADEAFAAEIAGARSGKVPSAEFRSAFQVRPKERPTMAPLPQPGAYADPATLTVYVNRQPVTRHAVETDEVLIGRRDPVADAYPDLDLTEYDPDSSVSRKHAYVYRQNKNYTIYSVSNAGTQLNSELLDLGDRRPLKHGDVIVLAGRIAMKFEIPGA